MELPPELLKLAQGLNAIHAEGVAAYRPVVEDIIARKCRDTSTLEHTLDGLLAFACTNDGVQLYRLLCRYIVTFDDELAARATMAYREAWDPDDERPWRTPT